MSEQLILLVTLYTIGIIVQSCLGALELPRIKSPLIYEDGKIDPVRVGGYALAFGLIWPITFGLGVAFYLAALLGKIGMRYHSRQERSKEE